MAALTESPAAAKARPSRAAQAQKEWRDEKSGVRAITGGTASLYEDWLATVAPPKRGLAPVGHCEWCDAARVRQAERVRRHRGKA